MSALESGDTSWRHRDLGGGVLHREPLLPNEQVIFESVASCYGAGAWGIGHLYVTNMRLVWLQYRWYFLTRTKLSTLLTDIKGWRMKRSVFRDELMVAFKDGVVSLRTGSFENSLISDAMRFLPIEPFLRDGHTITQLQDALFSLGITES